MMTFNKAGKYCRVRLHFIMDARVKPAHDEL
jgi:hypothetical protein